MTAVRVKHVPDNDRGAVIVRNQWNKVHVHVRQGPRKPKGSSSNDRLADSNVSKPIARFIAAEPTGPTAVAKVVLSTPSVENSHEGHGTKMGSHTRGDTEQGKRTRGLRAKAFGLRGLNVSC